MKRITIIGGGASGTLLMVNLLRHAGGREIEINLVERRAKIGRGVAFGTTRDSHLLNVPAGRMGAFPDDIDDFHKWLTEKGFAYDSHDFVPRVKYGEYLRDVFTKATENVPANIRLNLMDDEAVDMSVNGDSAEVMLRSGEVLPSSHVVLAFGNFKPPHPSVGDLSFVDSERYFQDPWSSRLYDSLDPDDSVFIVGTGLSMIDVALHLNKHGHRGKISAISTRGLLPAVHKLGFTYPDFSNELKTTDRITDILKTVLRHMKQAEATGSNWRAVIDSLRPATQQLWLGLPTAEKRYFKQHLSRYWNVARHRMPGEAAAILEEMQAKGSLEILKGRLKSITVGMDGGFDIKFKTIGVEHSVASDVLVNCIGSEANFTRIDSEFVRNLIARRHIRPDELAMGIEATPDGRVIDKNDEPSKVVRTLGTALKGILWESTAIPEIRSQARDLALKLLKV
ncbi:MAG: FAD/NAD(P)-binding protein [Acidobacteria bacterium]|nr:FAD/NAD(P)-binding protein [Acidobacteriota bacterium]